MPPTGTRIEMPFSISFPPTLVCGDFNTVFDESMDRRGSHILDSSRESSAALLSLFRGCGMVYIWRSLQPAAVAFSWLRPDGTLSSRIDLIGCPYSWIHLVQSCDMLACPFSDHCAVLLSVPIPEPIPRGPLSLETQYLNPQGCRF